MEIHEIISDVCRAKNDFVALAIDGSVSPERLAKCESAAADLETVVTELLTTAWIPRTIPQLTASIVCVNKNLQRVQADIAAALGVELLECRPDELYRVWCAMSFAELLKFQLDVLMTALAHNMMCPCGCGAFVPEEWAN